MKLHKTLFVTIAASGMLLVGADPVGHSKTEDTENTQNQLILGSEIPLRYINPTQPLQAVKTANMEELQVFKTDTQPTQTETVQEEIQPQPVPEPEPKPTPEPEPEPVKNYRELTVEATAYVSYCDTGCIGITKRGTDVRDTIYHPSGYRIVAVDPNVIPLGSIVEIEGRQYIADDTGGSIKGNRIDILVATTDTKPAFEFGRKQLKVKVY